MNTRQNVPQHALLLKDNPVNQRVAVGLQTKRAAGDGRPREHLFIIAMTAHALKGDGERYLASGMDAYRPKPIDEQVLLDIIESNGSNREPSVAGSPGATTLDVDEMCSGLGDDEELISDVIRLYLPGQRTLDNSPATAALVTGTWPCRNRDVAFADIIARLYAPSVGLRCDRAERTGPQVATRLTDQTPSGAGATGRRHGSRQLSRTWR